VCTISHEVRLIEGLSRTFEPEPDDLIPRVQISMPSRSTLSWNGIAW
jgi:hypothetical protein